MSHDAIMSEKEMQARQDMDTMKEAAALDRNPQRKEAAVSTAITDVHELSAFIEEHDEPVTKPFNGSTGLTHAEVLARKLRPGVRGV